MYLPMHPYLKGNLGKPPLKLGHGWESQLHRTQWADHLLIKLANFADLNDGLHATNVVSVIYGVIYNSYMLHWYDFISDVRIWRLR